MNKDNLLYYGTDGLNGYRAGSFWNSLMEIISAKYVDQRVRLVSLIHLFKLADTTNRMALERALPGVLDVLIQFENHEIEQLEALLVLEETLEMLPFLLMQFEPLVALVAQTREKLVPSEKEDS